ncbi:MAG TPA: cell division protein FtsZ, partial [Segetibacter sp.]
RHQYGNLKVREAFSKADDILATAAKCITDVITSNGQINVDFADVCTVMRNGGVAILGSATAEGEDRAQRAIEDAVNSPLLNDSEIRGAKWILINITSAEGDNEITMDEEDTIMSYLRQEAGDEADVIKGIGFDESLGNKIGVTIIATGFEHKDPFKMAEKPKPEKKPEEKIILSLSTEEKKPATQPALALEEKDPYAPSLVETTNTAPAVIQPLANYQDPYQQPVQPKEQQHEVIQTNEGPLYRFELKPEVNQAPTPQTAAEQQQEQLQQQQFNINSRQGNGLSRPSNIYAEPKSGDPFTNPMEAKPSPAPISELPEFEMKLVMKDEIPEATDVPKHVQPVANPSMSVEDLAMQDDADDQKRRAQERIQKLRNLSFNMNTADGGNEFDSVPAYIRRNMELFGNTLTSVENFYSKYTVKPDENDKGQISSINTFLDGKKPD